MEKQEKVEYCIRVFTCMMQEMVDASFRFPRGWVARNAVSYCVEVLEIECGSTLSRERIIDFCVCQVYAVSGFDKGYLRRWNASHSFGRKALERYRQSHSRRRYYEDRWLKSKGHSRAGFLHRFRDRKEHPLYKFIFPEYEEGTKRRMYNSEVGFYLCLVATLLWSPFSPSCGGCKHGCRCQGVLKQKYPELYRIRLEEYQNRR